MEETSLGLDQNVEAALSYSLGFLTGVILFLLERDNEFVRFHAAQSVVAFGGLFLLRFLLGMVGGLFAAAPLLGTVVGGLFSLVSMFVTLVGFGLWVLLLVKAFQGERYSLPVVGGIAEGFSS